MNKTILYKAWQRSQFLGDKLECLLEVLKIEGLHNEAENVLHALILVKDTTSQIDLKRKAARVVRVDPE